MTYSLSFVRHYSTVTPAGRGSPCAKDLYRTLTPISLYYPGFCDWYDSKVVSSTPQNERAIFTYRDGADIAAVAIAKRNREERKLCTLWVAPRYRCRGLGANLVNEACLWLNTSSPLMTVPGELVGEFRGLFAALAFDQFTVVRNYYRPNSLEYVFNGHLAESGRA